MRVWIEVITDLIDFVLGRDKNTRATVSQAAHTTPRAVAHTPLLPAESPLLIPEVSNTASTAKSVEQSNPSRPQTYMHTIEPERMYVAVEREQCYMRPVRALDSVIGELSYGAPVTVGRLEGRWAHIETSTIDGWVLKDAVVADKERVYPQLSEGYIYDGSHEETIKLRMLIRDMFAADSLGLPLQDIEFVTYRLQEHGRVIFWPAERPRTAGRWQQILRGALGIHVGISPVKHAVMETVLEDGLGLVEYVEAVHPDESVVVSGIDPNISGRYRTRTLRKGEWLELRPVFIEVTTGV